MNRNLSSIMCRGVAAASVFGLLGGPALADLIYSEGFVPSTGQGNAPLNDPNIDWQVFDANGVDISGVGSNPARIVTDSNAPDNDGFRTFMGGGNTPNLFMESDAPTLSAGQRDGSLTFSFKHRDSASENDPGGTIRFLARVGQTWYASDIIPANLTNSFTTQSIDVKSDDWHQWESNLKDGFDSTGISTTAVTLPSGSIDSVGLLLTVPNGVAAFRIDDFQINGTIPEPGALGLFSLGLLVVYIISAAPLNTDVVMLAQDIAA